MSVLMDTSGGQEGCRAGFDPQFCRVLALGLVLYPGALAFGFFTCEVEIVPGAPHEAEMVFA